MSSSIHVRMLKPGSHLGDLGATFVDDGEALFRALVEEPTECVSKLSGLGDKWPALEAQIVAGLASAQDDKTRGETKKVIPAICPARFSGDRRVGGECLGRQVIGHDCDGVVADTFEAACELVRARLPDRFLAIHTTASERKPSGWCLRAFELLDREATPAEWESLVKPHMRRLDQHDPNALDVARLFYLPVRTAGYRFAVFEGPRTRLDHLPIADVAPSPAPAPAPALVSAAAARPDVQRRAAAATLAEAVPAEGNGRHLVQRAIAGGVVHDGWSEAEATDFLCEVMRRAGNEDREKRAKTVQSTLARKAAGKPYDGWTTLGKLIDGGVVQHARGLLSGEAAIKARLEAAATPESTSALEIDAHHVRTAAGLVFRSAGWDEPLAPPSYVVDDLLVAGSVTLFVAHGSSLKSMSTISIGADVARGRPWLGRFRTLQGPAVFVDFERNGYEVRRRIKLLRADGLRDFLHCSQPAARTDDPKFWDGLAELKPRLVVVDSLAAGALGVDENERNAALPLQLAAKFAHAHGCAVLFVHHARKGSGGDKREAVRGSTAIFAAADAVFTFEPLEAPDGVKRMRVECTKMNLGREPVPFTIELSDERGLVLYEEPAAAAGRNAERSEDLQAAIRLELTQGRVSGVKALARKLAKNRAKVGAELALMVESREVLKDGEGYSLDDEASREARVRALVERYGSSSRLGTVTRLAKAAHVTAADVERLLLAHVIEHAIGNDRGGFIPGRNWKRAG